MRLASLRTSWRLDWHLAGYSQRTFHADTRKVQCRAATRPSRALLRRRVLAQPDLQPDRRQGLLSGSCEADLYGLHEAHGEKLVDNEAAHGLRTWASPADIARLLLMRRLPKTITPHTRPERFRVLGDILPELDDVIAERQILLPSPASPILPLSIRPALLAGIAIVERAGPAMLEMPRTKRAHSYD